MVTILLAEDNLVLGLFVKRVLQQAGYRVWYCMNTADAWQYYADKNPDLVLLDVMMPGIDGFELRNRARTARPDLPVFLITGRHEIADQSRAQGITGFFRKPFDGQQLLAAVTEALHDSGRRAGHEN